MSEKKTKFGSLSALIFPFQIIVLVFIYCAQELPETGDFWIILIQFEKLNSKLIYC